jgi:hypothetical protein
MDMKELYWLGGLLEGEGCFSMVGRSKIGESTTPRISIGSSDLDVIQRAQRSLGGTISSCPNKGGNLLKKPAVMKNTHYLQIYGRNAVSWMMTLFSLLGERRRNQVVKTLTSWKARPGVGRGKRGRRCNSR